MTVVFLSPQAAVRVSSLQADHRAPPSLRFLAPRLITVPLQVCAFPRLITVPLQVCEFFCVLSAANPDKDNPVNISIFLRLMVASIVMLVFGYLGETAVVGRYVGFVLGMLCWLYIVYEVFLGEAAQTNGIMTLSMTRRMIALYLFGGEGTDGDEEELELRKDIEARRKGDSWAAIQSFKREALGVTNLDALASSEFKKSEAQLAFECLRGILVVGWLLYPAGYLAGGNDNNSIDQETILNVIYNIADLLNKVAFGMAIWFAASSQLEREKEVLVLAQLPAAHELLGQKSANAPVETADWRVWKDESEALEELNRRAQEEIQSTARSLEREMAEERAMAERARARMGKSGKREGERRTMGRGGAPVRLRRRNSLTEGHKLDSGRQEDCLQRDSVRGLTMFEERFRLIFSENSSSYNSPFFLFF